MSLPTLIATACCVRRLDQTLFIDYRSSKHPLHAGKYSLPGGKYEKGESLEECAIRELKEETKIIASNAIPRGMVLFINEKRTINGNPVKANFQVYFCDFSEFDDSNAKSKEGPLVWVPNDKVRELPMHEGDYAVWKWLQEHERYFNAKVMHVGEKLEFAVLL